jgi:hypothetical protein
MSVCSKTADDRAERRIDSSSEKKIEQEKELIRDSFIASVEVTRRGCAERLFHSLTTSLLLVYLPCTFRTNSSSTLDFLNPTSAKKYFAILEPVSKKGTGELTKRGTEKKEKFEGQRERAVSEKGAERIIWYTLGFHHLLKMH